jgi:phosphoribosyl 1,2-cyclic phosphodiesterase
LPPVKA